MTDILVIRSKKQLWDDFIVTGLQHHWPRERIKGNLIEAVRKEVFDQMMSRMKVEDIREAPQTPKNEEIVKNISIQTRKKWESLIRECNKWMQTKGLLEVDDLKLIWPEEGGE